MRCAGWMPNSTDYSTTTRRCPDERPSRPRRASGETAREDDRDRRLRQSRPSARAQPQRLRLRRSRRFARRLGVGRKLGRRRRCAPYGRGVPCLTRAAKDPSGDTREAALAYASAIGGGRAGVLETSFREETETDLFGEQAVLCGGVTELVKAGYETLVEGGYAPEMAYFECLHELKLIVDLMYERGIEGMSGGVSNTAKYADYTRGKRVIGEPARAAMREFLAEIRSGVFAQEWVAEHAAGKPRFAEFRRQGAAHPIEEVGRKLRALMPWLRKDSPEPSEPPQSWHASSAMHGFRMM